MFTPLIVIPARYGSTRLPGKPLHPIAGMMMIERVWRLAKAVRGVDEVMVATDDVRIKDAVEKFGGKAVMTPEDCPNGTMRCLAAIEAMGVNPSHVMNMQGDAPVTPPWVVQAIVDGMRDDPEADIVTPAVVLEGAALQKFMDEKKVTPTSGTTVVCDLNGRALYFSKAVIPYPRGEARVLRHIGLYGYRTDALRKLGELPETPLEKTEKLEQLRALENRMPIKVVEVDYRGRNHASVDSPEDVARVEEILAAQGELV
ncbi:MAG: 3-deoxy-manno-octulosonate cytidylyltransferase [Proteobacteria bacterium]|nr:3-deoxy-manno-octulosonate cytidylyltransferase [Pseudomonadota bacterium]